MAPNIVLAPNMTQNAERKHRTQDTDTANFRSYLILFCDSVILTNFATILFINSPFVLFGS